MIYRQRLVRIDVIQPPNYNAAFYVIIFLLIQYLQNIPVYTIKDEWRLDYFLIGIDFWSCQLMWLILIPPLHNLICKFSLLHTLKLESQKISKLGVVKTWGLIYFYSIMFNLGLYFWNPRFNYKIGKPGFKKFCDSGLN